MINYLLLILSLLIPTIIGAGILFLIRPNLQVPKHPSTQVPKYPIPNLILSFGLGTGLTSFLMFWWGLAGLPFQSFVIILTIIAAVIVIFYLGRIFNYSVSHGREKVISRLKDFFLPKHKARFFSSLEIILILVILFEIVFVFSTAALRPVVSFDAVNNWAWKAKLFFYQPQLALTPGTDLFLGGIFQNYPLHVPLLMTWSYLWLGQVNDVLVGIIFAFYYLALIGFVYFSLRSFASPRKELRSTTGASPRKELCSTTGVCRKTALIFTAFLATLPLLAYHGTTAYADLPLTFYFTVAAVCLFKYFRQVELPNRFNLFVAGLFAGLTAWVKNEGLMLAGVLLIVFLIYLVWEKKLKKDWGDCLRFIVYGLLFFLPWMIFKMSLGFGYNNLAPTGGISFSGFHPEIFSSVLKQVFLFRSFHLWPGIFILILILRWRRIFVYPNYYLFLTFIGVLAAYLLLYIFTPSYEFVLKGTIVGRNFFTLLPISIFLAGLISTSLQVEPVRK